MIKTRIKSQIDKALTNEYFNSHDFLITLTAGGNNTLVKITYEYDDSYNILVHIPNKKEKFSIANAEGRGESVYFDYMLYGYMTPGELSFTENFLYPKEESLYTTIQVWIKNLWEELTAAPFERFAKKQKEEIEKLKEKANSIADEYFTKEEAEELKTRLGKVEKNFTTRIKELEEDKKIASEQIKDFKEQIEVLKQTIPALKKRGWFKSFITKTMTWFGDPKNQKLVKAGKDLVTSMLPENT